tara:strand:- start:672 stop:785 length:114 start_codon:yes stop_codon:yes gene_type:complete
MVISPNTRKIAKEDLAAWIFNQEESNTRKFNLPVINN